MTPMNIEQIKYIHNYLVDFFEGSEDPVSPPGIKNLDTLESAVNRPFMSVDGQDAYVGIFRKAAALFHSIINNHSFYNGNKRAALLSTIVFLGENGWWLTVNDEELFEFTRKSAAHELCDDRKCELNFITKYFQSNSRKRKKGEQQLSLRDLKEILDWYGFDVKETDGRIEIYKDNSYKTTILKKGAKGVENYDKPYIGKLRRRLKLTAEYGVDSYSFYGGERFNSTLGNYMKMRDKVMRELARI